jgi:hypothetical protein
VQPVQALRSADPSVVSVQHTFKAEFQAVAQLLQLSKFWPDSPVQLHSAYVIKVIRHIKIMNVLFAYLIFILNININFSKFFGYKYFQLLF